MDTAIVVTNDTDLIAPLRIAHSEAGVRVALVSPSKYAHRDLRAEADSVKSLRAGGSLGIAIPPQCCATRLARSIARQRG